MIRKLFNYQENDVEYRALTPKGLYVAEKFLFAHFWVFLFLLFGYTLHRGSLQQLNSEYEKLHNQLKELQEEKEKALAIQADFLLQVNSQSDQDWIELTLMKGLGLVPEEQAKVFFHTENLRR